jgi:hypothetical protein
MLKSPVRLQGQKSSHVKGWCGFSMFSIINFLIFGFGYGFA